MRIEQPAELVGATLLCSVEDGVDRLLHRGGAIATLLEIAGKELDRLVAAGLADLVDGATVIVGQARIKSALEGAPNGLDIAATGRGEHALAGDLVDMGLERSPARKAIVARDRELGLGELSVRVLRPQRLEALLRLVLQTLEIGL